MSNAIIRTGGKQFSVEEGGRVRVPSLKQDVGAAVELEVLATTVGKETTAGTSSLQGTKVMATVVDHGRSPKIIVFKKKRRKHYKRTQGHRQGYTTLKIDSIG
jgi:large subunit ribosomal protein L21